MKKRKTTGRAMLTIIDCCTSTNSALAPTAAHGDALMALEQTAGRGQRGNTWEAEPHKNITLSLMLRPDGLPAVRQFEVSEAVALGVADTLRALGIENVKVKWPNDIYVGDRKICGILIENTLGGNRISRSVAGIGLNVNQTEFRSDAPNPVSVKQLTGREHDIEQLAEDMISRILARMGRDNHADYLAALWRGQGEWLWQTSEGELFRARIVNVRPDGRLCLSGRPAPYPFKTVFPVM